MGFDGQGNLLVGTRGSVPDNAFRRNAVAGTWERIGSGLTANDVLAFERTEAGTLLAGSRGGLHRSTDGGATWARSSVFGERVYAFVESATGDLLAGTRTLGVQRSTDEGVTWAQATETAAAVFALARAPGGTLYAGLDNLWDRTEPGGVLRSTDDGATWTSVNDGFGFVPQRAQALIVDRDGRVYASFSDRPGPFRSDDDGATWTEVSAGLTGRTVRLAASRGAAVYAAQSDGSVYGSTDGGQTWAAVTEAPTGRYPASLAFGPDDELYVGTVGRGVYRSTSAVSAEPTAGVSRLAVETFPNPFAASTTVRFALDAAANVRVTVVDALGRRVATLADATHGAGLHEITWQPETLAAGVYMIRVEAGALAAVRQVVRVE